MLSYLFKLGSAITLFTVFIACEGTTDTENSTIPGDVTAFATAEEAADVAFLSVMGISGFIEESRDYKEMEEPGAAGMQSQSDTTITYYDDDTGWWHRSGSLSYGDGETGLNFEYDNQFQFFRNDTIIQWPVDVDAMHIIMDMMATFSYISSAGSSNSSMNYELDMIYSNLDTDVITADGDGHYDQKVTVQSTEGNQSFRYYLIYKISELKIPDDGYPTGTVMFETKNFEITIEFDGTATAHITVKGDGSVVWTGNRSLVEDN